MDAVTIAWFHRQSLSPIRWLAHLRQRSANRRDADRRWQPEQLRLGGSQPPQWHFQTADPPRQYGPHGPLCWVLSAERAVCERRVQVCPSAAIAGTDTSPR